MGHSEEEIQRMSELVAFITSGVEGAIPEQVDRDLALKLLDMIERAVSDAPHEHVIVLPNAFGETIDFDTATELNRQWLDGNKLWVIKEIRHQAGMGLIQAKNWCYANMPLPLLPTN